MSKICKSSFCKVKKNKPKPKQTKALNNKSSEEWPLCLSPGAGNKWKGVSPPPPSRGPRLLTGRGPGGGGVSSQLWGPSEGGGESFPYPTSRHAGDLGEQVLHFAEEETGWEKLGELLRVHGSPPLLADNWSRDLNPGLWLQAASLSSCNSPACLSNELTDMAEF